MVLFIQFLQVWILHIVLDLIVYEPVVVRVRSWRLIKLASLKINECEFLLSYLAHSPESLNEFHWNWLLMRSSLKHTPNACPFMLSAVMILMKMISPRDNHPCCLQSNFPNLNLRHPISWTSARFDPMPQLVWYLGAEYCNNFQMTICEWYRNIRLDASKRCVVMIENSLFFCGLYNSDMQPQAWAIRKTGKCTGAWIAKKSSSIHRRVFRRPSSNNFNLAYRSHAAWLIFYLPMFPFPDKEHGLPGDCDAAQLFFVQF